MQRFAQDFGNAGVVRFYCDGGGCGKPLLVCYRGRAGDYCSRACLLRCDPEREKVKLREISQVRFPGSAKVKSVAHPEVKTREATKVKTALPRKVRIQKFQKAKIEAARTAKIPKATHWKWQREERRAAVRKIRDEVLKSKGLEPTIAAVQKRLLQIGFNASVRSVWQDLRSCPPSAILFDGGVRR